MADVCKVIREALGLNVVLGENFNQIVVEEIATIPEPKPDIAQVISARVTPRITEERVIEDKVIVEGELEVKIVYEADLPSQPVHAFEVIVPFSGFVDVPGAEPGAEVFVNVRVEDVTTDIENDRKVRITAVLEIFAKVFRVEDIKVVVDVEGPPGLEIKREALEVEVLVGRDTTQVMVEDIIDIPEEKPNAEQVLDVETEVNITRTRILAEKVIVNGVVDQKVIYVADLPDQPVHVVHGSAPFSAFVEIPGAEPGQDVDVDVVVEDVSVDVTNDGDALRLSKVLKVTIMVTTEKKVEVVVDVKGIEGIKVTKDLIRAQNLLARESRQSIVRGEIDIPIEKPCVEQILSHEVSVDIEETRVIRDKVIIEGVLEFKVIYESTLESQAVHVVHGTVPFNTFVEAPGAKEDGNVDVDVNVEHVDFRVTPTDLEFGDAEKGIFCPSIDVTVVLEVFVRVFADIQIEVVVDVECPDVEGICPAEVTGDFVNIRTGPGTNFPVITQARRGARLTILSFTDDWARVRLPDPQGTIAFIFRRFVRCLDEPRG